ncbi:MAG: hypothetical protein CMJ52_05375 [Planctomycetaceae bacterium]|nr:hypothetical protein [Planctomycetaceae bacterium]
MDMVSFSPQIEEREKTEAREQTDIRTWSLDNAGASLDAADVRRVPRASVVNHALALVQPV